MQGRNLTRSIQILHVEDSPDDVELTLEGLKDGGVPYDLTAIPDGVEALAYLRKEREYADAPDPDIILLDLNLPRMDGREVLEQIKSDEKLMHIPVVVLTTSQAEEDILRSYQLHANCYVTKPVDLDQFFAAINSIENFWLNLVQLPCGDS